MFDGCVTSPASIEVIPAMQDQEPILANLIELYAHDFSEFHHLELGEDGRFGYKQLPLYWSKPGRFPFLVKADGKLAGFALVTKYPDVWDMAEFFIVRGYRRHGIGKMAAHEVWRRFPGSWQVRVMDSNRTGLNFWQRAITAFVGDEIQPVRSEAWCIFAFESSRR
jgi:predicted acetyltransferase